MALVIVVTTYSPSALYRKCGIKKEYFNRFWMGKEHLIITRKEFCIIV